MDDPGGFSGAVPGDCYGAHPPGNPQNLHSDPLDPQTPYRFVGLDQKGSHVSEVYETPNGSKIFVPEVKVGVKPLVGSVFISLSDAQKAYENYAAKSGFVTRIEASKVVKGVVKYRVFACHKAGKPRKRTVTPQSMAESSRVT